MASFITGRPRATTRLISMCTAALGTCTAMCGSTIMDPLLKGWSFITRMVTDQITQSRTCRACPCQPTPEIMSFRPTETIRRSCSAESEQRRKQRRRGTVQKLAWRGTASMARRFGWGERRRTSSVRGVAKSTAPFACPSKEASAPRRAKAVQEGIAGLTTRIASALFALNRFGATSIRRPEHAPRIVGVRRCRERSDVYDLTVEGAHCFYANGILVHNCHDALQYAAMGMTPKPATILRARRQLQPVPKRSAKGWT